MEFTRDEIRDFTEASRSHYDAVCRNVSFDGWLAAAIPLLWGKDSAILRLNWRDLDILSKIAESPLLPQGKAHEVWALFKQLRDDTDKLETILKG